MVRLVVFTRTATTDRALSAPRHDSRSLVANLASLDPDRVRRALVDQGVGILEGALCRLIIAQRRVHRVHLNGGGDLGPFWLGLGFSPGRVLIGTGARAV